MLPPFDEPPSELRALFDKADFLRNIRSYNNAFAFTSMGASVRANDPVRQDRSVADGRGVYTYRIQGALYHRIGALDRGSGHTPAYAQLYFYDAIAEEQRNDMINARVALSSKLDRVIVATLQQMFDQHNELARLFHHAYERMTKHEDVQLHIHTRLPGLDQRRYNRPTADEICGNLISAVGGQPRDIALQCGYTKHTSCMMRCIFPILHPCAEVAWTFGIPKARAIGKPDLFITVTCNPKRPEITEALFPRQQACDRPDFIARVFRLKLKAILEDLSA
uniref:Helitron_like_N domain-containing protein n=1 Tax=Anopheles christyi TaxID=43041 RepID=A0A182KHH5_9DIPT